MQNVNAGSKNHPQPIIQRSAQKTIYTTFSIRHYSNVYLKPLHTNIDVAWSHHRVSGEVGNDIWTKKFIHHQSGSSYLFDEGLIKIEDALALNRKPETTTKDSEHWPIKDTLKHSPQKTYNVI